MEKNISNKIEAVEFFSPESVNTMSIKHEKISRFFRLYTPMQRKLYSLILMMIHNEKDAEDLLQETTMILWEKFDKFKEGTNFNTWAFVIARNRAVLFLKNKKKGRLYFSDNLYDEIMAKAEDIMDTPPEKIDALRRCLKKLSDEDFKLLRLHYKNNTPTPQLAEMIRRPVNSVYRSLSRIHTMLRECVNRSLRLQDFL